MQIERLRMKTYQLFCLSLLVCGGVAYKTVAGDHEPKPDISPEFKKVEAVAIEVLDSLQAISFKEQREYCGWIVDDGTDIFATKAVPGDESSCTVDYPEDSIVLLASYHTHGQHNPDYWSEAPSNDDIESDFDEEIYGFVSTPAGRIWVIDPYQEMLFQICGEGCVTADPNYDSSEYPPIPESGTPEEINELTDS